MGMINAAHLRRFSGGTVRLVPRRSKVMLNNLLALVALTFSGWTWIKCKIQMQKGNFSCNDRLYHSLIIIFMCFSFKRGLAIITNQWIHLNGRTVFNFYNFEQSKSISTFKWFLSVAPPCIDDGVQSKKLNSEVHRSNVEEEVLLQNDHRCVELIRPINYLNCFPAPSSSLTFRS